MRARRLLGALLGGGALACVPAVALAADTGWLDSGSGGWNVAGNWTAGVPGAADTAVFSGGGDADDPAMITTTGTASVGSLDYLQTAGAYFLDIERPFSIADGIDNESAEQQTIWAGSDTDFTGGTIAGDVLLQMGDPFNPADPFNQPAFYVTFSNGSSAGSAVIVKGTAGNLRFNDSADAGTAQIELDQGFVEFNDDASAAGSSITVAGWGTGLEFYDDSSAGSASIVNQSGSVEFWNNASAGGATITNDPDTTDSRTIGFNNSSSAGSATITANGSAGGVTFWDSSTGGTATLIANDHATISFREQATPGAARLVANSGGTISISSSALASLSAGSIEGAGTLNLGSKALTVGGNGLSTEFSGIIKGSGALTKTGDGRLILSGADLYAGMTTIEGGILSVNGSLAGAVTVEDGGTLGGTGTIHGLTMAGGTLAPGNSIGTLHVSGDVTIAPGTSYDVEVDALGNGDDTIASGTATINGGVVNVLAQPGSYADHTSYTILSAASRSGAFDGVTTNFAFLTPSLSYDGQNVILTLDRNAIGFSSLGTSRNQRATAAASEALGAGDLVYDAVLGLAVGDSDAAFDALSGEIHASLPGLLVADSAPIRDAMLDRLGTPGAGSWGQFYGSFGISPGDGNAAGVAGGSGGLVGGADGQLGDWRLGALIHGGRGGTTLADRGSAATTDDFGAGLYGGTGLGATVLRLGADYAWHGIATRRGVAFPGFDETLTAGYAGATLQGFVEISHDMAFGAATLSPFARLAQVHVATDGFTEQGGSAALHAPGTVLDATITTLGARLEHTVAPNLSFGLSAGWQHSFAMVPQSSNAFAGGAGFAVEGNPVGGDALSVDGTLALRLGPATELNLGYQGEVGDRLATAQAARATLDGQF